MGRPLARNIDPDLDISAHFGRAEDLPDSLDAADLFELTAPVVIEVGSGKGMFLVAAAQADPGRNYLGIEIAGKYARYTASRLAKRELANARVISGDALEVFGKLPADLIAEVHVYFPDPWWKKRHRKRRVLNERFLVDVQRVLVPAGSLHFWTDVKEYFDVTLELIAEVTSLAGPIDIAERPSEHDLDYHPNFERRTRKSGRAVYRAEFRK
jgi:tRNA (guanine-N7-)-methyltransferase